jgi:hypothetical protein
LATFKDAWRSAIAENGDEEVKKGYTINTWMRDKEPLSTVDISLPMDDLTRLLKYLAAALNVDIQLFFTNGQQGVRKLEVEPLSLTSKIGC